MQVWVLQIRCKFVVGKSQVCRPRQRLRVEEEGMRRTKKKKKMVKLFHTGLGVGTADSVV